MAKPVLTGTDDAPDADWPPDDELLAAAAGTSPDAVAPAASARRSRPTSPRSWPARRSSRRSWSRPRAAAGEGADALVVEGVGGLLVPLTPGYLVRDLARELGLPLVVAARPALGTINHTLLTLEAARAGPSNRSRSCSRRGRTSPRRWSAPTAPRSSASAACRRSRSPAFRAPTPTCSPRPARLWSKR